MDPNFNMILQNPALQNILNSNPDAMKQMEGFWKYLDNMADSSPDEYQKFIDEQMKDMKEEVKKEKDQEEKTQTIQSEPGFCIKMLIARKVEEKDKGKGKDKKGVGVLNIFDVNAGEEIKESFLENDEKKDPLEEPKIYLNIVHNEQVLPPLNKARDLADPKNDRDWMIIPITFNGPFTRKSLDNLDCIHYDAHVHTCVIERMRAEGRTIRAITNYIITRFQEVIADQYVIHKKSVKFLKKRKYKCSKGTNNQKVLPYLLPKEHDVKHFKAMKEKLQKEQEEKQKLVQAQKEVKLPTFTENDTSKPDLLKNINIPGVTK